MKYIAKFIDYIDESTFICIIALALFILVGSTFSNFLVTSSDHRATQMYIGELKYNISIDNKESNVIVSNPGLNEYEVLINSLNSKSTFYKLVYSNNENLDIKYRDSYDSTNGSILENGSKKVVLLVNNKSDSDIIFDIKVVGGFITNGLDGIDSVIGYSFIDKIEANSIFNTILEDNKAYPDNSLSDYVSYESGIDYSNISGYTEYIEKVVVNQNISLISNNDKYVGNTYLFDYKTHTYTLVDYSLKSYDTSDIGKYTCSDGTLTCDNMYKIGSVVNNIVINGELYSYEFNTRGNINGNGLYYTSDISKTYDLNLDGKGDKVYYFRGNVNNNYVVYSNNCFKIFRTNEDKSIRLIYVGLYEDGVCPSEFNSIGNYKYNSKHNDNAYIGFMYGKSESLKYDSTHSNLNDSDVKKGLDEWYSNNITDTSKIVNSIYCNDRSIISGNGYFNDKTTYLGYSRLINGTPTFRCNNKNDRFTYNNELGNNDLSYSVGLITVDELIFAGFNDKYTNVNNYLYSSNPFYTMSPYSFDNYSYVFTLSNGQISNILTMSDAMVLPVISIDRNAIVASGFGTFNKPYIIK